MVNHGIGNQSEVILQFDNFVSPIYWIEVFDVYPIISELQGQPQHFYKI